MLSAAGYSAAEVYLRNEPSKTMTVAFVQKILEDPEMIYRVEPTAIMAYADFMHRTGQIKDKPASQDDVFFAHVKGSRSSP